MFVDWFTKSSKSWMETCVWIKIHSNVWALKCYQMNSIGYKQIRRLTYNWWYFFSAYFELINKFHEMTFDDFQLNDRKLNELIPAEKGNS